MVERNLEAVLVLDGRLLVGILTGRPETTDGMRFRVVRSG